MTNMTNTAAYEPPHFKTPYNHDTLQESDRTGLSCLDPSLAQQHMRDECDINTIVDRFLKTGAMPALRTPPTYADFAEVFDFHSAMNTIKAATDAFMQLPAKVRSTFQNDPAKFVDYVDHCMTTGDIEPLEQMGLTIKKPTEKPVEPTSTPTPTPNKGESDPK